MLNSLPPVTRTLLFLNGLIYLFTCLLSLGLNPNSEILQFLGWKQNDLILRGEHWRLLSAIFLHANLLHLFFNGYALIILGPETERIYGMLPFMGLYLLAGLAGSVASYAFSPNPSVGASGAIFGLIGGLAIFYYLTRDTFGEFSQKQLQSMVALVFCNLLFGFSAGGVIDNFAHIGGLVGGLLAGAALAPRYVVNRNLAQPVLERTENALGWPGAAGILIFLLALVQVIHPPI